MAVHAPSAPYSCSNSFSRPALTSNCHMMAIIGTSVGPADQWRPARRVYPRQGADAAPPLRASVGREVTPHHVPARTDLHHAARVDPDDAIADLGSPRRPPRPGGRDGLPGRA